MSEFQLLIVSSDQRLPSQLVNIKKDWKAIDLKKHLSKVFPGEPPVECQRLVFAGRLMTDESVLVNVIGQDSILRTVHLVLRPSFTSQIKVSKPPVSASEKNISEPESCELQRRYLEYLQDYYANNPQPIGSTISGNNSQFPTMVWPYMQMTQPTINPAAPQQGAAHVMEEEQQPRNRLQRWIAALGGNDAPAADHAVAAEQAQAPEAVNAEVEGFDIVDFMYAAFRFVLIVSLCVAYSSWQRMALVALVAAYFYWRNGERRNLPLPVLQRPPVQPPATEPIEDAANSSANPSTSQSEVQAEEASTSETKTTTATPEVVALEGEQQLAAVETPMNKIADVIKMVTLTSFRLVVAIFSSLVPELPMDLAGGA